MLENEDGSVEEKEDELIGYDDEALDLEVDEINQLQEDKKEEPEVAGENSADEVVFELEGEKIPYSKLTPDKVQEWYKDSVNKSNWQKENTRKAQEISEIRKEYEKLKTEYPEYNRELQEYRAWVNYMHQNPELAEYLKNYHQKRQGGTQENPGNNRPAYATDPTVMEMRRKLEVLEREREIEKETREREEALKAVLSESKEINRDDFLKFVSEVTSKSDLQSLYKTLYHAYRGTKAGDLKKQAEKEVMERIKKNKTLNVNTGGNASQVNLPENIDITKSYDDMFDEFKSVLGVDG